MTPNLNHKQGKNSKYLRLMRETVFKYILYILFSKIITVVKINQVRTSNSEEVTRGHSPI